MLEKQQLIRNIPCFASLTDTQINELIGLIQDVSANKGSAIVAEDQLVDTVYFIVSGQAEVSTSSNIKQRSKPDSLPIACLSAGETIGLNDSGFYSTTGKRTANVVALTAMKLMKLSVQDLHDFLIKYHLEKNIQHAALQMMRMSFIKRSLPFSRINHEKLAWLSDKVFEKRIPAGGLIFQQGEKGDACYLIRTGKVEISRKDKNGKKHILAELQSPAIFGEARLISDEPRNASASAIYDTELLVLKHEYLSDLLESEENVATMFMTVMMDRSLPERNPTVTLHHRKLDNGENINILKNPDNGRYFKLSDEGRHVWELMDGKHTVQEIIMDVAEKCDVFAPDMVVALISRLMRSGFTRKLSVKARMQTGKQPLWTRVMLRISSILEMRYAFGDINPIISMLYNKIFKYFFSTIGKIIISLMIFFGMATFIVHTDDVLLLFREKHASVLLLLAIIPFSLLQIILHELGHAFAVKKSGRDVHYMGIGWLWVMPVAFTDTSDMWLADRKSRMKVNFAGCVMDLFVAGLTSLLLWVVTDPIWEGVLWLFVLYTYVWTFRMLSPIQDMDGYYILMDLVEKNRLRKSAVLWLIKTLPKSLRHPLLFSQNRAEIIYWGACLIYLVMVVLVVLVVQTFIFIIMGINTANPYAALVIPLLVAMLTAFSIIAEIRQQSED